LGIVRWAQINRKDTKVTLIEKNNEHHYPKNNTKQQSHQAKKTNANPPPPNSTLNPETSSDSPSAKSKAVQSVSAKQEINQTKDKGRERKLNHK
jgi:hypothetical protein